MIRYVILKAFALLSTQQLIAVETTFIQTQLQKDAVDLSASLKLGTNPLQGELRPKFNPTAVDYEYHAWGEKNESNEYALYKWELIEDTNGTQKYELARYWVKMTNSEPLKLIQEENKERILMGGLTHKNLRNGADSGSFLIFSIPAPSKKVPAVVAAPGTKAEVKKDVAPEALTRAQIKDAPVCKPVPGKPGFVFSPTARGEKGKELIIDVRGLESGSLAKDPWNNKLIRIP